MASPTPVVQRIWPTVAALAVMLVACLAYFAPQLQGKVVPSGDTINNRGMAREVRDHLAATGERSLWTNSMFGGMPAYQIYSPERGNLLRYAERVLHLGFDRPIGYFFALMAGLFLLLRVLGVSTWLALAGALTFGLGANHMTLFEAGHMTKLRAISFMAPTLAGLVLLFRGRFLVGLGVFALALGLNLYANHPQMTFYLAAACGCFVVFRLIRDVQLGSLGRFGRALALSLLAAGLAVGASYSKLSTTIEYGRDTLRGEPILAVDPGAAAATSSSQVDGLEWEYAMQWSNGVIDVLASFVPGAAGGGAAVPVDRDGPLATALRRQGAQLPRDFAAPLYHGELPFTSGPAYFGAVAVFLFVLATFVLRPGWRYFFGSAVLVTLLLSMGKHAAWFNRPLFDLLPYFNNFRAPSSATSVTAVLVTAGGFAGLCRLLRADAAERRRLLPRFYAAAGITAGLLLLVAFAGGAITDLVSPGDARLESAGYPLDAIYAERAALMRGSALRALLFVAVAAAAVYAYLTARLGSSLAVVAVVGLASVVDVWGVSTDYLAKDDFVSARQYDAAIAPRAVDEQILRDADPNYRVLDLSVNTFNDARVSYFHKTIGGYHAAKLQRAQDLIDRHISQGNQAVLDMLNTRYIITGQAGQERAQRNPGALGNAWFVEEVRAVNSADAEIDALAGLDPGRVAVVHEEFAGGLPARSFTGAGEIALTDYAPNRLAYRSSSPAQQLAVFSEMWYGPGKGWVATIDGEPAELIRANYALRALVVPPGDHVVVMSFEPESFYRGETISYVASGLILVIAALGIFLGLREDATDEPRSLEDSAFAQNPRT